MARSPRGRTSVEPVALETLEARQLMFNAPFLSGHPSISSLENPNNTVVRFQTNWGPIDIELFDTVAPLTVANFLGYVRRGDYDRTFFHRLINFPTPFVLQGGGFKYDDATGFSTLETEPPVQNEFQRSNLEGTIAMAKIGGDPNSATSQFFFNLVDNEHLNTNNGGFTVFGHVVLNWAAVEGIGALSQRDFDQEFTGINFDPGTFDNVPVGATTIGPSETNLVMIWDAEIIKPFGTPEFYTEAVYFPEGFRGSTIIERVDLVNPDRFNSARYQIIVRYESGERDAVISTGTLLANQRRSIKISDFNIPSLDLVREGVGYAIEVRATRQVAAALDHQDTGVTIGESFLNVQDYNDTWLRTWTFGYGAKGPGLRSFLLLQNLSDQDAGVSVTIYDHTGTPHTFGRLIERYGRSGLNIGIIGAIPTGRYSIRLNSTQPIVAALSVYDSSTATTPPKTNGSTAAGVPLGGRTEGYLATARIPSGGSSFLSFMYISTAPAIIVDVTFYLQNGQAITAPGSHAVVLNSTTRRVDRNLGSFGVVLPVGQFFSIGYKVRNNAAPVAATYVSEHNGDTMSTPFTTASKNELHFADGYLNPPFAGVNQWDIYSLFNPYNPAAGVTFNYLVRFRFSDGQQINATSGVLGSLRRLDFQAQQFPLVLAKINSGAQFRSYSVTIETFTVTNETAFAGGAVAQVTRIHNAVGVRQTYTSNPTLDDGSSLIFMNDPQFD